jgi:hypothetical protein
MRNKLAILVLSLGLTISAAAQSRQQKPETETPPISQSSIIGTWKGEINQQPAVEVLLRNDGGKLAGTAVFYPIRGVGEEPPAGEKTEVSLIEPQFNGRALSFKIKRPDGATAKIEMKFVSETEAVMKPVDDPDVPEDMVIKMKKAK